MIVTYSGANVMYLPIQEFIKEGKDAGKLTEDSKKGIEHFKFTPGVNEVTPKQWEGIQAGIAKREELRPGVKDHYDMCLCVIGGKEQKEGLVIGPDEIDFLALHWQEAVKLVKGTVIMEQLEEYQALEKGNDKPRNSVLKAIDAQIREVKTFHKNIADGKKGD